MKVEEWRLEKNKKESGILRLLTWSYVEENKGDGITGKRDKEEQ